MLANDDKSSVLCEASGSKREEIAYSPYGYSAGGEGALGYNGERREAQVDYVLGNGYRTFSPLLMRFRSPDSWSPFGEGGLNAYMYVMGNPIEFADETGHAPGLLARIFRRIFGNKAKATTNVSRRSAATSKTAKTKQTGATSQGGKAFETNVKLTNEAGGFWGHLQKQGPGASNLEKYDVKTLLKSPGVPAPKRKLQTFDEPQSGMKQLKQTLQSPASLLSESGQDFVKKLSEPLGRTKNSSHDLGMVANTRAKT